MSRSEAEYNAVSKALEGMQARLRGEKIYDNPYKVTYDVYMWWRNGWQYADDHIELLRAEWEESE